MTLSSINIQCRTHRIIPTRFVSIGVFDDLGVDAETAKDGYLLEMATNARLTVSQKLSLIPDEEVVCGDGATLAMAAFIHGGNGRFNSDRLGVWYAGLEEKTAIRETVYHNTRRLKMSAGGFPCEIEVRNLICSVDEDLVDVRGLQETRPELYVDSPTDYALAQEFGDGLRWEGNEPTGTRGIVFDSVRHETGTNVCLFWPTCVNLPVEQGASFQYVWDKDGEITINEITQYDYE